MNIIEILNVIVITVSACTIVYNMITLVGTQIKITIKKMIIEELKKFNE